MRPGEFVTADHHFWHPGVLKHNPRPWDSVEEMNEGLIQSWNDRVPARGAVVYHLGDFSWAGRLRTEEILSRLNGTIRLVRGNHDRSIKGGMVGEFDWVKDYHESKTADGIKICMSHYAFQVWNKSHYGAWMLHGHSHGSLATPIWMRRLDVGVDTHPRFEPYSFDEIAKRMETRGFMAQDHHVERTNG